MDTNALERLFANAFGTFLDFHILGIRRLDVLGTKLSGEYKCVIGCDSAGNTYEDTAPGLLKRLADGQIDDVQATKCFGDQTAKMSLWVRVDGELCFTHSLLARHCMTATDVAIMRDLAEYLCGLLPELDGAVLAATINADEIGKEPEAWQNTVVLLRHR